MDTQSTTAEGRSELAKKYLDWKETYLPIGSATSFMPLDIQLKGLSNASLLAAHEAAMAGLIAEKLLAHINPIANFHYAAGLTTGLLFKRGLHPKRSWCETE